LADQEVPLGDRAGRPDAGTPIRGVLVDLDGVLVDSRPAIEALWRAVAARHDRHLQDADIDRHVIGCAAEHTVEALFRDLMPEHKQEILRTALAQDMNLPFSVIHGGRRFVARLAEARVPVVLVTGASAARALRAVAALRLPNAFASVVAWGDVPAGKPAPDCYLLAARRIGVPPGECLVIEDAPSGIRAACAAGAPSVGVGDGPALRAAGATWTVPRLSAVRFVAASHGVELVMDGGVRIGVRADRRTAMEDLS
jgi:beta-phosphoglucomutase-like phosphatase (HAD superfamily)